MPDDLLAFGILGWYIGKVLVYPRDRFTFFWSAIGTDSAPVACASLGQQSDAKSLSQGGHGWSQRNTQDPVDKCASAMQFPCQQEDLHKFIFEHTFVNVCW